MHEDGRVREAAVGILSRTDAPLADRMLAVRLTDHVRPVREAATQAVLRRTSLAHADWIVPVLHLTEGRELDHAPVLATPGRDVTIPQFAQPTELQRGQLIALLPQVWPETCRESRVAFAAGLREER
jgi:hypothetical protein